jgi:hypothetical protein
MTPANPEMQGTTILPRFARWKLAADFRSLGRRAMSRSLVFLIALLPGCSRDLAQPQRQGPCSTVAAARAAALQFLKQAGTTEQYDLEAIRSEPLPEGWRIWVPYREEGFPGASLIMVSAADCRAARQLLK